MSDAIGPGSWLQRINDHGLVPAMRAGSVWMVSELVTPLLGCLNCGAANGVIMVNDPGKASTARRQDGGSFGGWCHCGFRPYQGPEQASRLTCEPVDASQMAGGWRGLGK